MSLDRVWGAQAVSDSAVSQVIRELRATLDDNPAEPRLIATRHRHGYQLIAEVRRVATAVAPKLPPPVIGSPDNPREVGFAGASIKPVRRANVRAWAVVGLVAILAVWALIRPPISQPIDAAGWPTASASAAELAAGLRAARLLHSRSALRQLELVAVEQDTPRLQLLRVRLLSRLGRRAEAEGLLARLQVAAPSLERSVELLLAAVEHEKGDRRAEAGRLYSILATTHPDDVDYALAWWETDTKVDSETTERLLESGKIPVERRLLLAAEVAGRLGDRSAQLAAAEVAVRGASKIAPVIWGRALAEKATALAYLDRFDETLESSSRAIAILLAEGELPAAFQAWSEAAKRARNRARPEVLRDLLLAFEGRITELSDPLLQGDLQLARGRLLALEEDFSASLEPFAAAARIFELLGAERVVEVYRAQAGSLRLLGRFEEASNALHKALLQAEMQSDSRTLGSLYNSLAILESTQGQLDQALVSYQRALAEFRRAEVVGGELVVLSNLATMYLDRGDLRRVLDLNRQLSERARQAGNELTEGQSKAQLASVHLLLGELAAATRAADEGLVIFGPLETARFEQPLWLLKAEVKLRQARLGAARADLDRATELNSQVDQAMIAWGSAALHRETGERDRSRARIDRALRDGMEHLDGVAAIRLELLGVRLDLDVGRGVAAEQTARRLAARASRGALRIHQLEARILLARALTTQGKIEPAQRQVELAEELLERTQNFKAGLELALTRARLEATNGGAPTSRFMEGLEVGGASWRQRLDWVVSAAEDSNHLLLAFEARVVRLTLGGGWPAEAEQLVEELERRGLYRLRWRLELARSAAGS